MQRFKTFFRQFHWKILLIRILVNAAALTLTVLITPYIYFVNRSVWSIIMLAIVLGLLNAIVKPVILLLTGQLIFVTFGLLVILVNTLFLYLLQRFFPTALAVDNFFWAVFAGAILGLVSNALENLMGLTLPIVPDENLELRQRIEAEQPSPLISLAAKSQPVVQHDVETQSVSEFTSAKAGQETLQGEAADNNFPLEDENQPKPSESDLPISEPSQPQAQEPQGEDKTDPDQRGDE